MYQERSVPRMSIDTLGEYLVATAVRRHRIIADQKHPVNFTVMRYREATEAMISFLVGGAADDSIIYRAIDDLSGKPVTSDFQIQDRDCSIEALDSFLDIADEINLDFLQCRRGEPNPPRIMVAGISISVRPEIILVDSNRTSVSVGLIKLYLTKSYPLTDEAGSYLGAVLQQYVAQEYATIGTVNHRLCQTIDVFAKKIHTAPRSFLRRQKDIKIASEEIERAWNFA